MAMGEVGQVVVIVFNWLMRVRVGVGAAGWCAIVRVGVVRILVAVPMVMEGGGMGVVMAVLLVHQVNCAANH